MSPAGGRATAWCSEGLFPGLGDEPVAAGAPASDWGARGRFVMGGHRIARHTLDRDTISVIRPLLEDIPGTLRADLLVDCTGRGSRTPAWLRDLGYEPPPTEEVRIGLPYSTRHYRLSSDALNGDVAVAIGPTPEVARGGVMFRIEGDCWLVTLAGMVGETPPTDPGTYDGYASDLAAPDIQEALRHGEPLDDPVRDRLPANVGPATSDGPGQLLRPAMLRRVRRPRLAGVATPEHARV